MVEIEQDGIWQAESSEMTRPVNLMDLVESDGGGNGKTSGLVLSTGDPADLEERIRLLEDENQELRKRLLVGTPLAANEVLVHFAAAYQTRLQLVRDQFGGLFFARLPGKAATIS